MDCWEKLNSVISVSDRILLYGVAGTGKTYQANRLGLKKGQGTYNITLTADSTATELMGHYIATSDGGFRWKDGNGVRAFKEGARLVVNEIDHAGADVQTFLHALLDKPLENFQCIATMNGYPEDLPEPLADRFPVKINVDSVHPDALEGLGNKLRAIYLDADRTSFSVRKWIELRKLMESDVPNEEAVKVLFPDEDEQFALLVALGIQKEQYPDEEDE